MKIEIQAEYILTDQLTRDLSDKISLAGRVAIAEAASSMQIRVQEQGRGSDGLPLTAYSGDYAEYRRDIGRNQEVDLTLTGNMWQAFTYAVEVFADKLIGRLYFTAGTQSERPRRPGSRRRKKALKPSKPISPAAKMAYILEKRPNAFGLTEDEIARMQSYFDGLF